MHSRKQLNFSHTACRQLAHSDRLTRHEGARGWGIVGSSVFGARPKLCLDLICVSLPLAWAVLTSHVHCMQLRRVPVVSHLRLVSNVLWKCFIFRQPVRQLSRHYSIAAKYINICLILRTFSADTRGPQRTNPDSVGDPLTCPLAPPWGLHLAFSTDVHAAPQDDRMNCKHC